MPHQRQTGTAEDKMASASRDITFKDYKDDTTGPVSEKLLMTIDQG